MPSFDEIPLQANRQETFSGFDWRRTTGSLGSPSRSLEDTPLSVTEVVRLAKRTMKALPRIVVVGEVSGFRGPHARSGHCYFDLKDEGASMATIVWRSDYAKLGFRLKDGLKVQAAGTFDVYERSGKLSFIARSLSLSGEGELRQQVADLARRLAAEGLMADEAKRPIPRFCERVAVVTSFSGSVKDDVLRTLARRNPLVEVDMVACAVQGPEAPPTICRSLALAEEARPDAILLVRGGGSFEDLMAFNDESVARAIARSSVPVVTGIGHEPDVTIADMVADRRQSTPTAAAESVAPPTEELWSLLDGFSMRLSSEAMGRLQRLERDLRGLAERLSRSLVTLVEAQKERLQLVGDSRVFHSSRFLTQDFEHELDRQDERMAEALPRWVARKAERLDGQDRRLAHVAKRLVESTRQKLDARAAQLEALSPLAVLARGYAIVRSEDKKIISHATDAQTGETLEVLLHEGSLEIAVLDVHPEHPR